MRLPIHVRVSLLKIFWRIFDSGSLCGTALLLEREAHQSILLNSVRTEETTEIPVPLRHILPQRFTTTELIRTLRQVDALPQRSEFDVATSSDSRIVSLIPGLKEIRRRTLPQMYFERCKVYRGTFGRVHPLFNSEDDAVLIMWKPGKYHQVFFMFVSQLSPHHEQFLIDHWSMIVFEAETTGAVKRIVTPDEVALEDPRDQPPDYGPPMDDDMAYEPNPVSGEQQYFDPDDEDMNPPGDGPGGNPDDHQGGQPPGPPPTGPAAVPNQFGNPDVPLEQLGYPSSDPEEAMPEISSESRPPDDPGQPPIDGSQRLPDTLLAMSPKRKRMNMREEDSSWQQESRGGTTNLERSAMDNRAMIELMPLITEGTARMPEPFSIHPSSFFAILHSDEKQRFHLVIRLDKNVWHNTGNQYDMPFSMRLGVNQGHTGLSYNISPEKLNHRLTSVEARCLGHVFHVTKKENWASISRYGLMRDPQSWNRRNRGEGRDYVHFMYSNPQTLPYIPLGPGTVVPRNYGQPLYVKLNVISWLQAGRPLYFSNNGVVLAHCDVEPTYLEISGDEPQPQDAPEPAKELSITLSTEEMVEKVNREKKRQETLRTLFKRLSQDTAFALETIRRIDADEPGVEQTRRHMSLWLDELTYNGIARFFSSDNDPTREYNRS